MPHPVRIFTTDGWVDLATPGGGLVGAPIPWLVATIPNGYREFDGSAIVQATHPQLYALFGATMPDLRGRTLMGANATYPVASQGGAATHTLSAAETGVPAHGHGHSISLSAANAYADQQAFRPGGASNFWAHNYEGSFVGNDPTFSNRTSHVHTVNGGVTNHAGTAAAAHNNLPPYTAVRWITPAA